MEIKYIFTIFLALMNIAQSAAPTTLNTISNTTYHVEIGKEQESLVLQHSGHIIIGALVSLCCLFTCICIICSTIKRKQLEKKDLIAYNQKMYKPNISSVEIADKTPVTPDDSDKIISFDNTFPELEHLQPKKTDFIHEDGKETELTSGGLVTIDETPSYTRLEVSWIRRQNGYILCDDKWNGEIPIVYANRTNVDFYDCILDPMQSDNINVDSLNSNGGVKELNYTAITAEECTNDDYGYILETHNYAHFETALCGEIESGFIIIGKEFQNTLCLTAFVIARGLTLYIPPNIIHTNHYQHGLWKSYVEINNGDDVVTGILVEKSNHKHINLTFYNTITKNRVYKYGLNRNDSVNLAQYSSETVKPNIDHHAVILQQYKSTEL